ncbi:hypothetical protein Hypma_007390 [Hypsizygus marmoreus]|uniref:Alpha-type protein kinase domain-containing protein n=1 Tax=Hypsizygus marmoreus TaxID=39966 RepID=A0A369K273_HYPMA|nr:hypothetical protein Hypma_007390 [Hypsizygus marmoreus]
MVGTLCRACSEARNPTPDLSKDAAEAIMGRTADFHSTASDYRLHQKDRLNPGLQAANAATLVMKTQALKKLAKADTLTLEAVLFYFPKNGATAKKAQVLPFVRKFFGSDSAATLLSQTRTEMEKAWTASPASKLSGMNVLNFEDAIFGVQAKTIGDFKPTEHATGTAEAMFNSLKASSMLSEADIKARKINLRIYAYEAQMVLSDDDDDKDYIVSHRTSHRSSRSTTSAHETASRAKPSSKRKASNSISNTPEYKSSFHPRKFFTDTPPATELDYDFYSFTKTAFTMDSEGNIEEVLSIDSDKIEISRHWRKFIGDKAEDGYLGQGSMKFAFMGRIGDVKYAILQSKMETDTDEARNKADLIAELQLLTYGQYFVNSFAVRASTYNVAIPSFKWNSEGAFVGTVLRDEWFDAEEDTSCSLPFTTFLATPLLPSVSSGLYRERKFSGSLSAGHSVDEVGSMIDAYAYHTLVDSEGRFLMTDLQGIVGPDKSVILFDPQAHSHNKSTGFWDGGLDEIKAWQKSHKCNAVCRKLRLKGAVLENTGPLHHGFPSP